MQKGEGNIALVGSINRDTILTPDGVRVESYGGMLYSILSLLEMSNSTVIPVGNVGEDIRPAVLTLLDGRPGVDLAALRFTGHQNPHCVLTYDTKGQKQEVLNGGVPPVGFEHIAPYLNAAAICLNFITGTELSLETLQAIRHKRSCLIFMDLHSLTLATGPGGSRYLRIPPDWESWVACTDFLQCNQVEAALLAGESLESAAAARRFGEMVLSLGPTALLITRGGQGSRTISRNHSGRVEVREYCAIPAGEAVDETGCGDVFMMGFMWAYLQSKDLQFASMYANRVAGINSCLRGIEEIGQIGHFLTKRVPDFGTVTKDSA